MFDKITKGSVTNANGNTVMANRINKGTELRGDVYAETDIRIDGVVKGNIKCPAKVVLGSSAHIEGDITCGDLVVEGHIKGNINIKNMLYFKSTSHFEGQVTYTKIIIEEGAVIIGSLTNTSSNLKSINSSKAKDSNNDEATKQSAAQ
jgi:cytoskeletal protein CcmA (bactofilin family)